jgi:hypothetical protein
MFISKSFPNTPIEPIYNCTGVMFTPLMIIGQMTLPFYVVYFIIRVIRSRFNKEEKAYEQKD